MLPFHPKHQHHRIQSPHHPSRCYPCNVQEHQLQLQVYSHSRAFPSSFQTLTAPNWVDSIDIRVHGNTDNIKNALLNGNLLIVSDGSFKIGYATGAYIITSLEHHSQHFITGTVQATGPPTVQESYRAELAGILAGCYHLQILLEQWGLHELLTTVTFGCDNLSALDVCFDHTKHPNISPAYDHYDLIQCVRSIQLGRISILPRHIEGHQDNHSAQLDTHALLNVHMDRLSKETRRYLEENNRPNNVHALLPSWHWMVFANNQLVCKKVNNTIVNHASLQRTQKYLLDKSTVPHAMLPSLDWATLGAAMNIQTTSRKRWITKHTVGMCGVNLWRKRWNDRNDNKCPRCRSIETAKHVYMCQDDAVVVQWVKELKDLSSLLEDLNTCPAITAIIVPNLDIMYNGGHHDISSPLAAQQNSIGWQNFFEGLWHHGWVDMQRKFLQDRNIKASASAWGRTILDRFWAIHFRMWQNRNAVEHQNDHDILMSSFNNRIEAHIQDGFDWLPRAHRRLISPRELTHVQESTSAEYKRSWLRNIEALQRLALNPAPQIAPREIAQTLDNTQPAITDYFHPQT